MEEVEVKEKREKALESHRKWRQRKSELLKRRKKKSKCISLIVEKTREKAREYYKANRVKICLQTKFRRDRSIEKVREQGRRSYRKWMERVKSLECSRNKRKEIDADYRKRNLEKRKRNRNQMKSR